MPCYFLPAGIRFNDYLFTDPVSFSDWHPPGCAGVLAVLGRNPQWAPKPLQPLVFTEFGNNAVTGAIAPRLRSDTRAEDLFVATLVMPYSTSAQRRAVCKELVAAYNPAWQANGFALSTAELADKVEQLEVRQQEQGQQILSLLTFIGNLFEPQPVTARRPIGFLPQILPAGAGATESGK